MEIYRSDPYYILAAKDSFNLSVHGPGIVPVDFTRVNEISAELLTERLAAAYHSGRREK